MTSLLHTQSKQYIRSANPIHALWLVGLAGAWSRNEDCWRRTQASGRSLEAGNVCCQVGSCLLLGDSPQWNSGQRQLVGLEISEKDGAWERDIDTKRVRRRDQGELRV